MHEIRGTNFWDTLYCSLFNFLEDYVYALEDSKKSLGYIFLIKLSYGPYTRNPFTLEGYHWVVLSVLSLFILFPVVFSVVFWSLCLCTYYIIFFYLYLPLKAIRSSCCRIIKKVRVRRKLTFQTRAFRLVIRAKILFDHECKTNPLLST